MKLLLRISASVFIAVGVIFYFFYTSISEDISPRYQESVEEVLNDAAHILAAMMEAQVKDGELNIQPLRKTFRLALKRRFAARIYLLLKDRVNLFVYVTDANGVVIYDSDGGRDEGNDFSKWNDVLKTLRGEYGARSSEAIPGDPESKSLFVAAPIMHQGELIGVLSVVKRKTNIRFFTELTRQKLIAAGILAVVAFLLVIAVVVLIVSRPLRRLIGYVRRTRDGDRGPLPKLGGTELRDLGEAFEELREKLEGKRYIERYVQTLAHELKSPLTSIRGAAELLSEDMPPAHQQRFIKNIRGEAARIEAIVSRLLELSALERRRELRDVHRIDLTALMRQVMEELAAQAESRDVEVKSKATDAVMVMGETFLLQQALRNLLQNALNFSPVSGPVTVTVLSEGDHALAVIEDRGPGVPEYALPRIFDRFYSLPALDTDIKGTGLGLPFVREVALLHGGTVTINNREEGGAVATLRLPSAGS